jgi:hypothetical protein
MKLNSAMVERTLRQYEAQPMAENHPAVQKLRRMYGDHTYLLGATGLHIVEPAGSTRSGGQAGKLVKLADWTDRTRTRLAPHNPEPTDVVVTLDGED